MKIYHLLSLLIFSTIPTHFYSAVSSSSSSTASASSYAPASKSVTPAVVRPTVAAAEPGLFSTVLGSLNNIMKVTPLASSIYSERSLFDKYLNDKTVFDHYTNDLELEQALTRVLDYNNTQLSELETDRIKLTRKYLGFAVENNIDISLDILERVTKEIEKQQRVMNGIFAALKDLKSKAAAKATAAAAKSSAATDEKKSSA